MAAAAAGDSDADDGELTVSDDVETAAGVDCNRQVFALTTSAQLMAAAAAGDSDDDNGELTVSVDVETFAAADCGKQ